MGQINASKSLESLYLSSNLDKPVFTSIIFLLQIQGTNDKCWGQNVLLPIESTMHDSHIPASSTC